MNRADIFDATSAPATRMRPRAFVETFQRDLLRLAFALTGDDAVAIYLARDVLLDILHDTIPDEESDPNSWSRLVVALGQRYMQGADPEGGVSEPANDEAGRLREAVELLSRPMRTALVLRDLGGLSERDVSAVTGIAPDELDDVLDWSRDRLNEAAGRFASEPPQRLLAAMAVDAPRRDLWPDLAPVVEEREAARRRQSRRIVVATLLALLLFASISIIWLLGDVPFVSGAEEPTATAADDAVAVTRAPVPTQPPRPTTTPGPTPTPVEWIGATLGDGALIQGALYDDQFESTGEQVWFSFEPDSDQPLQSIPSSANDVSHISPDGRWVVFLEWRHDEAVRGSDPNASPQYPVLSVTHDGVEQGWEYRIPPVTTSTWDLAIVGDRLYVLGRAPEPATITAIELTTGEVVAERTLEVPRLGAELRAGWVSPPEGSWYVNIGLHVAPEATDPSLYAYVTLSQFGDDIRNRWTRWLYRIDPTDLSASFLSTKAIIAKSTSDADSIANPDFALPRARVLPDGAGLYTYEQLDQQLRIQLLDFENGQIESLETSFLPAAPSTSNYDFHTVITSNDGRRLYVYSELSNEVAIVDLAGRQIERTFPLDLGGMRDIPIPVDRAHLAHDGQHLYLLEAILNARQALSGSQAVWVIDLATWSVIKRIEAPGNVESLWIDPARSRLFALSQITDPTVRSERWRFVLVAFDAQKFEELERIDLTELVGQNGSFRLVSLLDRYRGTYGRTPTVAGVEPQDLTAYATLPQARIITEDDHVPLGVTTQVELQFLDPATGEVLTRSDPRVRYDPGQPVTLAFEQPGAKSLISVSAELAPGQQQGTFKLKSEGYWNARIIVGDEDEGFTLVLRAVFQGMPAFAADDGRTYTLRLETDPDEPIPTGDVLLRVYFVEAVSGEPLPEGVSLVDGLPEAMRATLLGNGVMNRNLVASDHGSYETTVAFESPGTWTLSLSFVQPDADDSHLAQIEMNAIEVVAR